VMFNRPRHRNRSSRVRQRALPLLVMLAALTGSAAAQLPDASPAAVAESAQPVRVVCIADTPDAFLRDETFRERVLTQLPAALPASASEPAARRLRALITPLAGRFIVPLGSGFVVDPERRHVVSNWQVATACTSDRAGDRADARQLGIIEAEGADIAARVAERLPDRMFQDSAGNPVKLVQVVCRDARERCDADLPRAADDRPLPDALRRRQLDQVLAYAPDLAVLRLRNPARAQPLPLALNQQLDDQMRLVARAFGPLPVGAAEADAAARQHLVAALSVAAVYTGPRQINFMPQGGQPDDQVLLRLHRLGAVVHAGQGGAPVLRGSGVVGVLTLLSEPATAAGASPGATAHAVPVTVLASFLDLLRVPYITTSVELPMPAPQAGPLRANPQAAEPGPWADPQRLMLLGALALGLLAAAAFFVLSRRPAAAPAPVPPTPTLTPLQPQRTVSRVNPTLLHAVAMPTAALEVVTPPAGEAEVAEARTWPPLSTGVHLHCSAGPLAPATFSLPMPNGGTTLFVGRDALSCQVVFAAATDEVSAVHACFVWDGHARSLSLRDLSSSGTWVNGQRIAKGRTLALKGGDQVDLGGPGRNRFTIEFAAAGASAAPEAPR